MELLDGQVLHCLWVSRDPEDQGEGGRSSTNITLASSFNSSIDVTAHSARNVRSNIETHVTMSYEHLGGKTREYRNWETNRII